MRDIIHIDVENRYAVVQPGVVNRKLTEATRPFGLHFAPDPSSQQSCTIGGNVGENAGGPHCLKHGVTTDHVLGLEVVLPDGEAVRLGGCHPFSPGYDLVGLFTGTEGTFGVVTEITVKLLPLPAATRTYLAIFETLHLATRTVADITLAGILPVALEILDHRALRALEASVFAAGYPADAGAVLLIELDGLEAGMDQEEETIKRLVLHNRALEFRAARDEAERERLWRGRKGAYGAMGRIQPDLHILDGVVPRTRLEDTLEAFDRVAEKHALELTNVFHAGDGNVHPSVSYDRRDEAQVQRVLAASRDICAICVEAGGTLSGEHGIGLEKKDFLPMLYSHGELDLLRQLKRVVDPEGLANPGKIFPAPEAAMPRAPEPDPASAD
jgi:glycolate oxidase subunit GlcD